jgi:predicted amidohydrolase YtcJ
MQRTLALFILSGLATTAAADPPRTILFHGDVFTADPAMPHAQAIAITGDRITAVGSDAAVLALATPGTRKIDLGGRVVFPGLNDAHVHVAVPQGVYVNAPDFVPGPGPTLTEIKAVIAQQVAATPPGTLLLGFIGTAVLDDPAATRFSIDMVAPAHPVVLFGWSGHGTLFDTRAMTLLGISDHEANPFGGGYGRLPFTTVLDGRAHEYAEFGIRRKLLALVSDDALVAAYRGFSAQAVQLGFTSLQDMAVGLTHQRALSVLRAADLPVRVRSICVPLTPAEPCATSADPTPRLRAAGVKWITDGTPIERRAFVMTPYADSPDSVGEFNFPPAPFLALTASQRTGAPARDQVLFHSVGDAAISNVLDALEATGGSAAWANRRTRIEHGDMMFGDDIARAAALGVIVVQNGTHLGLTQLFAERLVPAVFEQLEPLRSLLAAGVQLALGTDGIGRPLSPFVDIMLLVIHPTHPAEALSVEQAVTAYTRGSAYAEFEEHRKGTLAPGRLADVAVLSQDIFHVQPFALPATFSVMTIVGGDVVWDAGVLH